MKFKELMGRVNYKIDKEGMKIKIEGIWGGYLYSGVEDAFYVLDNLPIEKVRKDLKDLKRDIKREIKEIDEITDMPQVVLPWVVGVLLGEEYLKKERKETRWR